MKLGVFAAFMLMRAIARPWPDKEAEMERLRAWQKWTTR